jgi:hypothetical protein
MWNGCGGNEMGWERQRDAGRSKPEHQNPYRHSENFEKYIRRYLRMAESISEIFPDPLFYIAIQYYYDENVKIFDKKWSQNTSDNTTEND